MKTLQRTIDNISGFELTKKEKALIKGGDEDEITCDIMCQVMDQTGPIDVPACCPHVGLGYCEAEFNWYYYQNNIPIWAECWEVNPVN
jgi:hypothetical protein